LTVVDRTMWHGVAAAGRVLALVTERANAELAALPPDLPARPVTGLDQRVVRVRR
jgi:hypothetical protein